MSCGDRRRTRRTSPELADILRAHIGKLGPISRHRARTAHALMSCRTARLGGHVRRCDQCGHRAISYNSCRNRHCPKCQRLEEVRWLEAQQRHLLPIGYYHVVFTIPQELHPLFLASPRCCYAILMTAASATLIEVGARPRNLGAKIGVTAVLHTWTQTLCFHPHVHCIVTGGGLASDGRAWRRASPRFLFSVDVLSLVFRAKLLNGLERAAGAGDIPVTSPKAKSILRRAANKRWTVYSKAPFAGPQQVLRYLSRYTHRIAISNSRIVAMTNGEVTFRWRDRTDHNRSKLMILDAAKFLRRYLLHVLPPRFKRIRHCGLLANGVRTTLLARCRALLEVNAEPHDNAALATETWSELLCRLTGRDPMRCPSCDRGTLRETERLPPVAERARPPPVMAGPT